MYEYGALLLSSWEQHVCVWYATWHHILSTECSRQYSGPDELLSSLTFRQLISVRCKRREMNLLTLQMWLKGVHDCGSTSRRRPWRFQRFSPNAFVYTTVQLPNFHASNAVFFHPTSSHQSLVSQWNNNYPCWWYVTQFDLGLGVTDFLVSGHGQISYW